MSQVQYFYLTVEAFNNIHTKAHNFRNAIKAKASATAPAAHEFYTGDRLRRVSLTYHLNKINGVWLINRIDIGQTDSTR
jgi:hypothetical protein